MKKTKKVAVDAGNKNIKVMSENHREPFCILNTMLPVEESRFSHFRSGGRGHFNPLEFLDVTVTSNGNSLGRKLVGERAAKKGADDRQLNKAKHDDDEILFGILTAAAVSLFDKDNPRKTEQVALGTCLPTKEYFPKQIAAFEEKLVGTHVVKFHDVSFPEGSEVTLKIAEDDLIVQAEGTTALLYITTDEQGAPKPEFTKFIEDRLVMVVDAGGSTTDLSATLEYEPVEDLLVSLNVGMLNAQETILKKIAAEEPDYEITKHNLDDRIRNHKGILIDRDREWDASDIINKEIDQFTDDLAKQILNHINQLRKDLRSKIARIVLTGGATEIVGESLANKLGEQYSVIVSDNAMYDNVLGAFRMVEVEMKSREKISDIGMAKAE